MSTKIIKIGLALASMGVEKAEKHVNALIKKGEIDKKEGRKLVKEFVAHKKKKKKEFEAYMQKMIKAALDKSGLAKKSDLKKLEARIGKLEKIAAGCKGKPKPKSATKKKTVKKKK